MTETHHKQEEWKGSDNPGWRSYASELRRIGRYALHGQVGTVLHRTQGLWANFRNFTLYQDKINAECPCCGWQGPAFISLGNWRAVQHNSSCPRCSSRSRHRGLFHLLPEIIATIPDGPALVFAPEPALMPHFQNFIGDRVQTTDYNRKDVDFPGEDIQKLSFADNTFAFLMCNHVLEHIPDDQQALRECARVLKTGGVALFTIPGDFSQQDTWQFDKADETGHFRHYGMDVLEKMNRAFSQVEYIDMGQDKNPHWHIRPGDLAFICHK